MSDLTPPWKDRDPGDMTGLIVGIPEQIEGALDRLAADPWELPDAMPDLVAVGAMGGSAMSAGYVETLFRSRLPHPMLIVRDYVWPACVKKTSLAVLSSYSGNTEETLSLYAEARERGVPRVAITTGGEIARLAVEDGIPMAKLPGGSPPRAAMYGSLVTLTALFHAIGWIDDPADSWKRAAARLRAMNDRLGPAVPETDNPAKQLARELVSRNAFVYAADGVAGPVATRVRHQLNENAKVFGHSALVPELNHNEIVSWERPSRVLQDGLVLVLHDAEESSASEAAAGAHG